MSDNAPITCAVDQLVFSSSARLKVTPEIRRIKVPRLGDSEIARFAVEAAAEGVQDRLVKSGITLDIRAAPDIGEFVADERRVRQSLFNLLANAVGFSPAASPT